MLGSPIFFCLHFHVQSQKVPAPVRARREDFDRAVLVSFFRTGNHFELELGSKF